MPRNIVICCDGTNNQFGPQNTNVVRLVQAIQQDPACQLLYYDPGVGTLPEPGWHDWLREEIYTGLNLAFGFGIRQKVELAYAYLMNHWQEGDRVFLFGFSRGAYTVRVLAAMLHSLGLLPPGNEDLVPYAMRLFKSVRPSAWKKRKAGESYWRLCDQFRATFARPTDNAKRHFETHFLGVWDTVSSVGWLWNPISFPDTAANPSVAIVRHAISIDERRWFFRQNQFTAGAGQNFKEFWFAGVHCDIGGGYPEKDGSWRVAFEWMLEEARQWGLGVDQVRLADVLRRDPPSPSAWAETVHQSLTWPWWPAELVPKWTWIKATNSHAWRCGWWGHRYVDDGSCIERSALQRIRDPQLNYRPKNLSSDFVAGILRLAVLPESVQYRAAGLKSNPPAPASDGVSLVEQTS